jgi:predicted enzyme related to lactoylglutathione lyase
MTGGIGQLRCVALDVNDLAVAESFWSAVTGLPVIPSVFPGRYSYLGQPDPWRHEMILHLVDRVKAADEVNRCHVDIWVRDVNAAIERITEVGGTLKLAPSIYPRPGSYPGERPGIDWAVMRDPFGNEFCLVSVLSKAEADAVLVAAATGELRDDEGWRAAAGRA